MAQLPNPLGMQMRMVGVHVSYVQILRWTVLALAKGLVILDMVAVHSPTPALHAELVNSNRRRVTLTVARAVRDYI